MTDKVYLGLDFYIREDDSGDTVIGIPPTMADSEGAWYALRLAHQKILRLQQAVKDLTDGASIDWSDLHRYGLEPRDLD